MVISGIYAIRNIHNGHQYVGCSINIDRRIDQHKRDLSKGKHHSRYLQNAWNKYGASAFAAAPLIICSEEHFQFFEQCALDNLDSAYNMSRFGGPGTHGNLGHPHTEEAKLKMNLARKGKKHSEATKALMSEQRAGERHHYYGKHRGAVSRQKISATLKRKGVRPPDQTGFRHAEETKARIGAASQGNKYAAKLTRDEIKEIRKHLSLSDRRSHAEISRQFGVSRRTISNIARGDTWVTS
ncbi:hypothetical protein LCGC14_2500870 [marine sediment metagenome]|uniref:GIY-YIG domain-containing protein n=1 Tax=marine sediment metagenome TaxID=412755 RepID=A0A0F9B2N2_9ZZZZ